MNRIFPLLGFIAMVMIFSTKTQAQYFSKLEKLNTEINTKNYDEIRPVVSPDGQQLFFTREAYPIYNQTLIEKGENLHATLSDEAYQRRLSEIYSSLAQKNISTPEKSSFNQDIWVANSKNADFDQVTHPHYPLNNAFPNSICAFNTQENSAIVVNQFPEEGGIRPGFSLVKRQSKEHWSNPEAISIEGFDAQSPDVNLSLSEDGEVLILSMQGKRAYGNSNDLYVCFRISEKKWSQPKHLGPAINSVYHEKAPFLSKDKKTLFYASNRRGGAGGSDLYFVQRLDETWNRWTAPRHFLSPVNSKADESHPYFNKNSGYLYFSSRREGSSDIYRIKIALPHSDEVAISGQVIASNSYEKVKAVIFSGPSKDSFFKNVYESTDGHYRIRVPKGEAYEIMAQRPGYVGEIQEVEFNSSHVFFKDHKLNLVMNPMESGQTIPLKKIFFHKSKAVFLESSMPVLEQLSIILKENPNLYIRIEGHTDNLGDKLALQQLSEDRSIAIKSFLIDQKGIDAKRIATLGFGDSFPLNDNHSESLRQRNRRVEIKIDRLEEDLGLDHN